MDVIFDLDQTLVDSSIAEGLRKMRDWASVYKLIPNIKPFSGIKELLERLQEHKIPIFIVTSSPRSYYDKIINNLGWNITGAICYHDTKIHKPDPEPILEVLSKFGINPNRAFSIGDESKDIIASNNSGVFSIAALWGTRSKEELLLSNPCRICKTVKELELFLFEQLSLEDNV